VSRQLLVASVALAALLLGLSACGGSEDKADPEPTKTTASPTPTPTMPVQPKGADGVTYDILNWDKYADDPVVLAYKKTNEALNASINRGKVLPDARRGVTKARLRKFVANLQIAKKNDWHLPSVAKVKVRTSNVTGAKAVVTMCVWRPTIVVYDKANKVVGKLDVWWDREVTKLTKSGDRWVMTARETKGKCSGGAPA
jgi:hypothetical protein